jgi:hypothetical protein
MPVPETAVHEYNLPKPPEHQIGLARKIRRMQSVTKPHRVNHAPDRQFRSCIHAAHAGHVSAAFRGAYFVHGYF